MKFRRYLPLVLIASLSALATGCGSQGVMVAKTDPTYQGAQLFQQHCSGCHTLSVAGTQGSRGPEVKYAERNQGPNLNTRPESPNNVLFAIRNGGFSGAIMPSNVVVGQDAQQVAAFVSKYAGHGPQG